MSPVIYEPITTGPYVGRYIVTRRGERRMRGLGRRPYYGHVWRDGDGWRASVSGGGQIPVLYQTRDDAALVLLSIGKSA